MLAVLQTRPRDNAIGLSDGADDILGDLVLQRKDVASRQIAVKGIRPQMRTGLGFGELRGHANCIGRATYAAFENILNAQLLADRADVDRPALVLKARITSDNEQVPELGQSGYDFFRDPIRSH